MKREKRAVWTLLCLLVWAWPSLAAAHPPVPPEAAALPEDEQWLLWRSQLYHPPAPSRNEWVQASTAHLRFHALPGTAAARDLPLIIEEGERSLARVVERLQMPFSGQLDLFLVERVFWQGGAAWGSREVLISYADRNYVGVPLAYYLDHELTHAVANRLIPRGGSSSALLAEGLATWATGGHYGPEPIHAMAAALPGMGRYIPLQRLRDDFHAEQHEIAYIEAASFVGWLIERYGLASVKEFYGAPASAERFFGAPYDELEAAWLRWLQQEQGRDSVAAGEAWWRAQIRFFDLMRAYQTEWDPFARELPAAPSGWDAAARGAYADNRDAAANIALETHLLASNEALLCAANPAQSQALLDEIAVAAEQGGIPPAGALGQRLQVATLLAAQDAALRTSRSAPLLQMAAPDVQEGLAAHVRQLFRHGTARQETVRLHVLGDQALALVAWHPLRGGQPRAFRYRFDQTPAGWRLTHVRALSTDELVPRSQPLCMISATTFFINPPFGASTLAWW